LFATIVNSSQIALPACLPMPHHCTLNILMPPNFQLIRRLSAGCWSRVHSSKALTDEAIICVVCAIPATTTHIHI
jgi:hypothetical protein